VKLASILALGFSLATVGCGGPASSGGMGTRTAGAVATESTGQGAQATDFTLRDLDGREVRLSDYLGKQVVLLDFFATWCVPCAAELPHLEELYSKNKDQGFVVLGIAMDGPETVAQVPTFSRRYALTFPVLPDTETKVVGIYNPKRTAPLSILIDRKGVVARVRSGYSAGDEKLIAEDVSSLLK
jgi:peroxiredoxin